MMVEREGAPPGSAAPPPPELVAFVEALARADVARRYADAQKRSAVGKEPPRRADRRLRPLLKPAPEQPVD